MVVHRYMVDIFEKPELRLPSFASRIAPREYAVLFAALKRTI